MAGQPQRVLVTGATGFIGGHLAEALQRRGAEVRVLARDPRRLQARFGEVVRGDLADPAALTAAVQGVDVVYHVAGLTKARRESDYFAVNHVGTVHLLDACRRSNSALRRFVLVSSQAAAGPSCEGRPVRESDPPHPVSAYGLSKLKAEQAALACSGLFPVTIVRPPVVYGPRDRDTLLFFRVARYGLVPRLAVIRALSIVHVADLVRGIRRAAETPAAANRVYFLANEQPVSLPELAEPIARALGARPIPVPVPVTSLFAVAALAELLARLTGRITPITRNKVREATQREWVCDPSRAARELGWRAEIPLLDGLRETAAWYRQAGWL